MTSLIFISQGSTALSFAADTGSLHIVKYLIDSGADIDRADNEVGWQTCAVFI